MSQENVDIARGAYDAFARGDIESVVATMDPGIVWVEPETPGLPEAGTHTGTDAVVQNVFGTIPEYWDEFAVVPDSYHDAGDVVFTIGAFVGRSKAGNELRSPFVHVLHMQDGKLTRFEAHFDTAAVVTALGKQVTTA